MKQLSKYIWDYQNTIRIMMLVEYCMKQLSKYIWDYQNTIRIMMLVEYCMKQLSKYMLLCFHWCNLFPAL